MFQHEFLTLSLETGALIDAPAEGSSYLDEHLGTRSELGLLVGDAEGAHGLAVTGEFQGEVLGPHALQCLVAHGAQLLLLQGGLVDVDHVHLLAQHGQGGLGGLSHLLIHTLCLLWDKDIERMRS